MRRNPVLDELGSYAMTELQALARDLAAAGERVIDFSIGDPREPTPPFIAEALRRAVPEVSQYPTVRGLPELRNAVADYVGRRFGVVVDPATQIVPTSGSKEAIFSTPFAFVAPGDAVVFGTPGYPIYERGTRFAGAEAVGIRLTGDFVLRAGDIPDDVWARTRLVWICSPHNPTGAVTALADLEALLEKARAHDVLLLADECYADLYEGEAPPSVLQVAGEGARGVLSYLSLSKRSGMTGYRSGAFVGDAEAVSALAQLRASVGVAPAEFVQASAVAAWSDDAHAAERREIFARKRAVLAGAFRDMGYGVVASRAGIYLWIEVDDDVGVAKKLLADGVVVSPGSAFGAGGEGHIRLALVPTVEECVEAVEVLERCLKS
ncbi:MAG TPA: aminotransferase class I/II-fold pyridoxal phosphate-dependent enzyme [Gemmatimonadales bacterium]|nr:aminotransferase class I/II-fold pyridoxal phosphate-dependent enzyme [Gemmatimonadales bacterium]